MPSRSAASAPSTTVGTLARGVVEEAAVGELAADGVEHVGVGGDDGDAAGHALVDEVVAPDGRIDARDARPPT